MYFDLGGEYDLMDDHSYESKVVDIRVGRITHAKVITPVNLGFTCKGVPIDVASVTGDGATSVVYIMRWIQTPIEITTKNGRNITLTQVSITFVRRTTNLLILGKRTCTLCGYRTITQ